MDHTSAPRPTMGSPLDKADSVSSTSLAFNPDVYLPMLEGYDLTDAQARELLATLWSIMCGFVELGLRVDVCGELGLDALWVLSPEAASLDSSDRTS